MIFSDVAADRFGHALAMVARAADRLLDRVGLAPPRLDLPPQVLDDLHSVFGDSIDPAAVVIRCGHLPRIPHSRAFALPGLIYLGSDPGIVDTDPPRATPTLVHELVHIWQGRHLGPRYVPLALLEQVRLGRRAYDWRAHVEAVTLRGAESWRALPVEAHAQLVSEAYAAETGGALHAMRATPAAPAVPAAPAAPATPAAPAAPAAPTTPAAPKTPATPAAPDPERVVAEVLHALRTATRPPRSY